VDPALTTLPQSRYGELNISPITLGFNVDQNTLTQPYGTPIPIPALTGILPGDNVNVQVQAKTISSVDDPSGHSILLLPTTLSVGSYTLFTSALLGAQAVDYALPYTAGSSLGTITVAQKALIATVANSSTTYGTAITPTVTISGLAMGQTVGTTVTTKDGTGATITYGDTTDAGSYIQSVTALSGAAAANYALDTTHSVSGTLTISPKPLNLSLLQQPTGTYGSPVQVGTLSGVLFGDDVGIDSVANGQGIQATHMAAAASGGALSYAPVTDVGIYSLAFRNALTGAKAGDYTLSGTVPLAVNLAIQAKPITYSIANTTVQYGGYLQCEANTGCYEWTPGATTGAVTLNGVLTGDNVSGKVQLLDLLGEFSTYGATTVAGSYFEVLTGLTGPKALDYTIASTGSVPGILTVEPVWVTYATSSAIYIGGSGLYGTPGLLTGIYTGANAATGTTGQNGQVTLLNGDTITAYGTIIDPQGNQLTSISSLIPGTYYFPLQEFDGAGSGNYRPVPLNETYAFASGPHSSPDVGTLSVFADSTLGLGLVTSKTIPPVPTQSGLTPPNAMMAGEQLSIFGNLVQNGVNQTQTGTATSTGQSDFGIGTSGIAAGNAQQTTTTGGVTIGAQEVAITQGLASAGVGGVTAQASATGNINVSITSGPGTAAAGVQADVMSTTSLGSFGLNSKALTPSELVKLVNLQVTDQAAATAYVQGGASGGLGNGVSGSVDGTTGAFVSASTNTEVSLKNGALAVSNVVGGGATAGVNGSISGTSGSVDTGVTVYSPGSIGEQVQINAGYSNGNLSLGLNLGAEIGIAGVDLSLNVSVNVNAATDALASVGAKMMGVPPPSSSNSCGINCVVSGASNYNMQKDPAGLYQYLSQNNFGSQQQYYGDNPAEYQSLQTFYTKFQSLATNTQSLLTQEQNTQQQLLSLLQTNPQAAIAMAHSGQITSLQTQETRVGFQAQQMGVKPAVQNNALTFVDTPNP
jgi:hypothetical protein